MAKSSKLLTAKSAAQIDAYARETLGVPILLLMENAGRAVAQEAFKLLLHKKRVAIFCGKGNNGGDGFVAARHLLSFGIKPDIFLAAKFEAVKAEARINLEILFKLKQRVHEIREGNLSLVNESIAKYDLIIDALLGVGLKGEAHGIYRELIKSINLSGVPVLSVDIPSGLDATSGKVMGEVVKANYTLTFVAQKLGMVSGDGPLYCGRVIVSDLGVPL